MKKKIFTADYTSKGNKTTINILAYDNDDALNIGWDYFDHAGGNFKGYDENASLIIMGSQRYSKSVKIDAQ